MQIIAKPNSSQLIDQHRTFDSKALSTILEPLANCQKDYFTVAIIGSQNTGKSTLLNELFHTNFTVLQGLAGTRTTRGVVLGRDYASNLVIMDVQGNDSYQTHLEGDQNYEKMVSSFALVSANLLIVNVMEKQLGQRTGSQYETLSLVLRICIDQFKQQSPKTILFCLRDANPGETDEGECRRKLQTDIQTLWKGVWAGTKKAAQFEKYQATPERFFTLEVAFLREFDRDYPEQFREDVAKLRDRFLNPDNDGYLFKRQKREYNIPAEDLPKLLDVIWNRLISNNELNLPNQKVQLASYRCQEIFAQLQKVYDKDLSEHSGEVRNYGEFLSKMGTDFRGRTQRYGKSMSEKWEGALLDKFKPKISTVIYQLLGSEEEKIVKQFEEEIKENIFYEQEHTLKEQAQVFYQKKVEQYVNILRSLGIQLPDRAERIQKLSKTCQRITEEDMKHRTVEQIQLFETDGHRKMQLLAATAVKDHLDLQFWSKTHGDYRKDADILLEDLKNHLKWARGTSASSNELDDAEQKLYNWLVKQIRIQFQANLGDRLLVYFKRHFFADQHDTAYNFNVMEETKISQIYSEAKEMTFKLLEGLNNFRFEVCKRSSFISAQDLGDLSDKKSFLQANSTLSIKEGFEHRANEQYYTVVRRRKESQSKKVPWYFFLVIIYFIYDDLPSPIENQLLFKLTAFFLVFCTIPYAIGQGAVVSQLLNAGADGVSRVFSSVKSKFSKTKQQ